MDRTASAIALLTALGADQVEHPGGTLLAHLERTSDRLRAWGAAEELVLAGLTHAAYGTDAFPVQLVELDERATLAGIIGERAEAITYLYGSCDRAYVHPQIGRPAAVGFRDRFTGTVTVLDRPVVRDFAELTVANELDLVDHSPEIRRDHGAELAALFEPWHSLLGRAASEDCRRTLAPSAEAP